MATLRWAEICDHVILEQRGKVGIIGMFDQINARGFPAEHPDFWVACKMEGYPKEKIQIEISIIGPDGEIMASIGPIESFASDSGHAFLGGRIFRPKFPKPGRYEIRIRPAGNPATSLFLNLVQLPASEQSQQQS